MVKGFFILVLWLALGLGFTGVAVLTLNAWMMRGPHGGQTTDASQATALPRD